jgi:predicted Zn-dependent protease
MTRKSAIAPFIACVLALAGTSLAGCAVNPATGARTFTGLMTTQDEIRIGQEQHPQIVKAFGGEYGSPELRRYVASIGELLARTVERPELDYTFTILDSDIVNAFALPGGYVYVSRGLLTLAGDEAELAAVLGHELGHITARHHAQRAGQQLLAGVLVTGLGVAVGGPAADLGNIVAAGVLSSYSRQHEHESDTLGIRYLSRVGYDPNAMADFLTKLRAESRLQAKILGRSPDDVDRFNYLATHPAPAERVQRASTIAAQTPVREPMRGRDIYLEKIDGMLYGDSPEQGFVRGLVFSHPKLRFTFEAPQGFRLVNTDQQVIGVGPDDSHFVFDRAPQPPAGSMRDYLTRVWAKGATLGNVETIRVNGLEAATGTARGSTNAGPRDVRLVAIRVDAQTIYRFLFVTPTNVTARLSEPFRRTTHSFRMLSEAEAAQLKPLRVRVVQVSEGDTVASLAARMPFAEFRKERFRVLNGLDERDRLTVGQRVKIVTEE